MSFIDDIKNCFLDGALSAPTFRAVMFGDSAVYLECITAISHYDQNEITLCLKKGAVKIKGECLYVKKYCEGDVTVCGKIKSVEMV